ncbi:hypothetical protein Ctob_001478 [Chrysochromulina tobinii]|uniref:Beta-ketoacyl synthase-like N-terminal domain-containing protein n=1 Tax=Chrysochromulina tobinii TaxID=1460289 RepID=A0A0M0J7Y4_9EUKA|nr:hypothetical protein Ctob_001478 [Chrysochromulina tobinii]|eukprot:KOO22706.1 hypothetical protein Ctob_001478 [Chrysochromulina sp. CCMP291]
MQQRPTGRAAAALSSFDERMQSAPLTAASYGGYVYGAEYFDAASFVIPAGEPLAALVAAANLILVPNTTLMFARAGMLSADGRCKTFDARANGRA